MRNKEEQLVHGLERKTEEIFSAETGETSLYKLLKGKIPFKVEDVEDYLNLTQMCLIYHKLTGGTKKVERLRKVREEIERRGEEELEKQIREWGIHESITRDTRKKYLELLANRKKMTNQEFGFALEHLVKSAYVDGFEKEYQKHRPL